MSQQLPEAQVIDLANSNCSSESQSNPTEPTYYCVAVPGQPRPQPRPRFNNGGIFSGQKNKHTTVIRKYIKAHYRQTIRHPIFNNGETVEVKIQFLMKRPLSDFMGGRRSFEYLRANAFNQRFYPSTPDIDNLTKLVLDACSGLFYQDDKQVVKLDVIRMKDNTSECSGRTLIHVQQFPCVNLNSE
jgi:Holliday junction resolvase RusA-like endonuclease